jgi:hypothetical protein
MNARNIVVILLAGTVCLILSASTIAALFYPPGTVTETFRLKVFEILIYIMGIVSGWLMGKDAPKPPEGT